MPEAASRRFGRLRKILAAVVVFICLAALIPLYVGSQLVGTACCQIGPPPADLGLQSTTLQSQSGAKIATWYCTPPEALGTVVLVHGIGANRLILLERARILLEENLAVVLIDLQSHGESTGRLITLGHLEKFDVAAAVAFARKENPQHRVGVIGISLGGAAALLASPLGVDAMVVESVFPAIDEAIHNRVGERACIFTPVLSGLLLAQIRPRLGVWPSTLRPIDRISQVDCPVLIASGDLDQGTTLAETERLFAAARQPRELVIFQGAKHVDLQAFAPNTYREKIVSFLLNWLTNPR